jgi:hypothetical protein
MMEEDYDVVTDTLQKHWDILNKMVQQNMNADMFNIMESLTYGTPIPYRYCSDSSSSRAKKRDRATRALSQTPHPAEPQGGSENLTQPLPTE